MNVILTGASGLVGQGVLIECLRDPRVASVLSLGRSPSGRSDPKLTDLVVPDMADVSAVESQLSGKDACFYCAGAGVVGSSLRDYRSVTFDMTLHIAQACARMNPGMTFVYVSGAGSDPHSPIPWLRIKGEIEAALQSLPLRAVMLRAGGVQPVNDVRSGHGWLRAVYKFGAPALSLATRYLPNEFTTTERMGRAMIEIASQGERASPVVDNAEINRLGAVAVA